MAWAELREADAGIYDAYAPFMLAELEASTGAVDDALAILEQGIAIAEQREFRIVLPRLHRTRADILVINEPVAAEAAYLESIRLARSMNARTFVLQAALPLARLLQSASRHVEAHAVLGEALEGFAPTPEFPAIAEAEALLAALAETGE